MPTKAKKFLAANWFAIVSLVASAFAFTFTLGNTGGRLRGDIDRHTGEIGGIRADVAEIRRDTATTKVDVATLNGKVDYLVAAQAATRNTRTTHSGNFATLGNPHDEAPTP